MNTEINTREVIGFLYGLKRELCDGCTPEQGRLIQDTMKYAIDCIIKYQQMQADYENRLKADLVAMLEELDSEIQEQIAFMGDGEETNGMKRSDNLVKDKINALKQSIWQYNYNGKKEWLDGTNEKTSD